MRISIRLWFFLWAWIFVGGCGAAEILIDYCLERRSSSGAICLENFTGVDVKSEGWQKWNTSKQEKATSELDNQVCRFDCNEAEKVCLDSISEEDTTKGNLQCEKDKEMCFYQCGEL